MYVLLAQWNVMSYPNRIKMDTPIHFYLQGDANMNNHSYVDYLNIQAMENLIPSECQLCLRNKHRWEHLYDVLVNTIRPASKSGTTSDKCPALFIRGPHISYYTWLYVPCDERMPSLHICMRHTEKVGKHLANHTTNWPTPSGIMHHAHHHGAGIRIAEGSMSMAMVPHFCSTGWTLIRQKCFRVNKKDFNSHQLPNMFHTPLSDPEYKLLKTDIKSEDMKCKLWALLEILFQRKYTRYSNIPIPPYQHIYLITTCLKSLKRCAFYKLNRIDNVGVWIEQTDCSKKGFLAQLYQILPLYSSGLQEDGCHFLRLHGVCYFVGDPGAKQHHFSSFPHTIECSIQLLYVLHESSFFNKLSERTKEHGLILDISSRQNSTCKIYRAKPVDEINPWYITRGPCSTTMYILEQENPQQISSGDMYKCQHSHFQCLDGTCIIIHHQCDGQNDCVDASDEIGCEPACNLPDTAQCFTECFPPVCTCTFMYFQLTSGSCVPISKLPNLSTNQNNSFTSLKENNDLPHHNIISDLDLYSTHYACTYMRDLRTSHGYTSDPHLRFCFHHICPGLFKCHNSFCIPYRYVCDGRSDCPSGEDELNCRVFICPGLLRCKTDSICLATYEVCDGIIHCLKSHDDEILCDLPKCPAGCKCYGLALKCDNINLVPSYHKTTKAMDLSSNHIILKETSLSGYIQLNHINISGIQLSRLPDHLFINQIYMSMVDISINKLDTLYSNMWHGLLHVSTLNLQSNKIQQICSYAFYGLQQLPSLDLSFQEIVDLHGCPFEGLSNLMDLNMACNQITSLGRYTLMGLTSLKRINLVENPISFVNEFVFSDLHALPEVLTNQTGIYCFLLEHQCIPQQQRDAISCKTLIGSNLAQLPLAVSLIILTEGVISISFLINKLRQSSKVSIRILYLHISDSIPGVSLLVLYILNKSMNKQFFLFESDWLNGFVWCKLIGACAIFSMQCSILTTLVIALEKHIIIHYPLKAANVFEKMVIPLNLYWSIAFIPTILVVVFLEPINPLCLHFGTMRTYSLSWALQGALLLINLFMICMIMYILFSVPKVAEQTRKIAGRTESHQDISLRRRIWACLGVLPVYGLILCVIFALPFIKPRLPDVINGIFSFVVWPIPFIINPFIYTLARTHFRTCMNL